MLARRHLGEMMTATNDRGSEQGRIQGTFPTGVNFRNSGLTS